MIKTVNVIFAGNTAKEYGFLTLFPIKVDAWVVCDTARGPVCGKVVSVKDEIDPAANRWFIDEVRMGIFLQALPNWEEMKYKQMLEGML